MYKIYLRTHDQQVDGDSKTTTSNQVAAAAAFAALVARADLDGQRVAAVLSHKAQRLAFHRFDRPEGESDNWRGRLDEIEWPEPVASRGGARSGAGRKIQTSDGGPVVRKNVSLDERTVRVLTELGGGELSEGIRRAALAIAPPSEV
ncbi:hypothetical protein ASF61_06940 [Duganella sp. Leaf126]|uniref:hypothetical protein n=1 Tax=Duganella sp. Leaf126 TaxID=1736266 RepID=UPI0006F7D25F|nr:hypothetical protein [Duganella sp. Leaf126]KQQ40482.1 hypothetical protein ASF61_06940 [Duganella sp. Leaf126]